MIPSPTDEIRAIRKALAAQFDNDIHRICEETRRQEVESGRVFVTLPPRPPYSDCYDNQEDKKQSDVA
jgi:hypothetical protein